MAKRLASIVMGDKLILPVQSSRIRQYVPHVKFITHSGRLLAVMPHKLEESKILRNLGIATPSPILSQYQWKGRYLPFAHQRATADFITMNPKCYVFNGLGSGKTKSVLWAADYLSEVHLVKRVLIVCPVSVMGVWEDEIFSTTPDKPVSVLTGTKEARLKKLAQNAPICIINFDGVKTVRDALAQGGFDLIVVDECSDAYRNAKTDRHKALSSIIKPTTRLVLMTATPTTTGPTDAYGLSKLMNQHDKLSFTRWRDMVMRKTGPFKWVVKPGADRAVHDLLQPAIKFATEDCIDLPPITYMYKQAGMGVEQTKAYKLMKRSLVAMIDGGQVTAPNAAVLLTKLLQISLGVVKDGDGTPRYLDNDDRLATLLETVREAGNKAIVFVPYRASQTQVRDYLIAQGLTAELVNGDTPPKERVEIFREFQNGDLNVLVAHPRTAAHGLNLTSASTVIWFGPTFSLEHFKQACARIARPGQKNHMTVVLIYATGVEKEVFNTLKHKEVMLDSVMELFKNLQSYD